MDKKTLFLSGAVAACVAGVVSPSFAGSVNAIQLPTVTQQAPMHLTACQGQACCAASNCQAGCCAAAGCCAGGCCAAGCCAGD